MRDFSGPLDTRKLQCFCAVAKHRSFRRAARALSLSQPALSRHIQSIEEELGVILLHRGPQITTPTEAGLLLLERATEILRGLEEVREQVIQLRKRPMGLVRLAGPASFSSAVLPVLLERVKEIYPDIQVRVIEGSTGYVEEWLLSRLADIGVIVSNPNASNLVQEEVLTEELAFLTADPSIGELGEVLELADLIDLPLVLPPPPVGSRRLIDDALAKQGLRVTPYYEIDSAHVLRQMVLYHNVHTIMPPLGFLRPIQTGQIFAHAIHDAPHRKMAIATLRGEPLSGATRLVGEEIRRIINELEGIHWRPATA